MDFVIDSVEVVENIHNKPTYASLTFKDVYEAAKNMRYTKDSYDRSHWQIRGIGQSEEYNKAINDIASIACAGISLNQALTPQKLLESISKNRNAFDCLQELANSELNIMLTEIDVNNKQTIETINRYVDIGLIDADQYKKYYRDCQNVEKAMFVGTPQIIITLVNDANNLKIVILIHEGKVDLDGFRVGKYIKDVLHLANGTEYDLPEQIQFKDIERIIGLGIEIDLNYFSDTLENNYKVVYNKYGELEQIEKSKDGIIIEE